MGMFMSLLFSVIDVFALLYFVKKALNLKELKWLHFFIAVFIQVGINTVINQQLGYGNPIGFIVMAATTITVAVVMFKSKTVPTFIIIFTGLILLLLTDGISVAIISVILNGDMSILFGNPIFMLGGTLSSKAMFYVIAISLISKIIVKKELVKKIDLGRSGNSYIIAVILLFNSLLVYTIIYIMRFTNVESVNQMRFVQIGTVFMIGFTIFISYILTKNVGLISKEIEWEYKEEILRE